MESIIWFLIIGGVFFLMMKHGCGAHMVGHGGTRKATKVTRAMEGRLPILIKSRIPSVGWRFMRTKLMP